MMNIKKILSVVTVTLATTHSFADLQDDRFNVLFIMTDDLNDYLGSLGGHPQAQTPNLDRFAKTAVSFTNAQCAAGWCAPSRAAFLSGVQPYDSTFAFKTVPDEPVLQNNYMIHEYFRNNGYHTISSGKTEHKINEDTWSQVNGGVSYGPYWKTGKGNGWNDFGAHPNTPSPFNQFLPRTSGTWGSLESAPNGGLSEEPPHWVNTLTDKTPIKYDSEEGYLTRDKIHTSWVEELFQNDEFPNKPFYLNFGLVRPHTAMHVEQKFFDAIAEDVELTEGQLNAVKEFVEDPDYAKLNKKERRVHALYHSYDGDLKKGLEVFTRAYLASVKAADANIGRVLNALDNSPYRDNTIVIVTSDHGWHNGEHRWIGKSAPFEETCRVPFLIRVPGMTKGGEVVDMPISLVDIYPTLIELCALEGPNKRNENGFELSGTSIKPLLNDPSGDQWNGPKVAITSFNEWRGSTKKGPSIADRLIYSVRSKTHRYIHITDYEYELYDMLEDPAQARDISRDSGAEGILEFMRQQLELAITPKS